jgi:hypothetical protein
LLYASVTKEKEKEQKLVNGSRRDGVHPRVETFVFWFLILKQKYLKN